MAGLMAGASAARSADVPAESLAEHRLKEILSHQKEVFADAKELGDRMEQATLQNRAEQLVQEYESLLKDNPNFATGYADYGYLLRRIGMRKQAVAVLLKANQLDPDIAMVKNELGNYLAEEGKPLEALNYFLSATKLEPKEPLYHYQIGTLLHEAHEDFIRSGEWTRASIDHAMVDAFRIAAELAPDRIEFTYRYGESFFDVDNPDWNAALAQWERLEAGAQSDDERNTMRLQKARVLIALGRKDKAREVIALVKDPKLDPLKQKLFALMASDGEK